MPDGVSGVVGAASVLRPRRAGRRRRWSGPRGRSRWSSRLGGRGPSSDGGGQKRGGMPLNAGRNRRAPPRGRSLSVTTTRGTCSRPLRSRRKHCTAAQVIRTDPVEPRAPTPSRLVRDDHIALQHQPLDFPERQREPATTAVTRLALFARGCPPVRSPVTSGSTAADGAAPHTCAPYCPKRRETSGELMEADPCTTTPSMMRAPSRNAT